MKKMSIVCRDANALTNITELLSHAGIDIRDIDFQQLGEDAIVNLVVADEDQSLAVLTGSGYSVVTNDTILLSVEDRPGALAALSRKIADLNVTIRSLTLVDINAEKSVVAISTTDNEVVRKAYNDQLIN